MVSHYRIVEKIGAGGMGEVYLAEDTELERQVALKFLPSHLCQDDDCRKRFKREAQAVAKLDHPNIIHVYEVSEFKGRPFFSMQHVEGQTLKEYSAGKDASIEQILELGIQMCEGLQDAHEKGVTHRDIKPSNILIDSHGRAKIVDFGLASVVGSNQLTKTGSTLGTVGYMSPEQVQGKEVDHRSDLFSLGVVLYGLITGHSPFARDNDMATGQAILTATPHPIARYNSDVSDELQRIVSKCLSKDKQERYQSAADVIADLQALKRIDSTVSTTSSTPQRPMLVVIPFENLGPSDEEYFTDGITEEITSRLAAVRNLGVISRTSAIQYKQTSKTIKQIGCDLGVNYVLEGTVRWGRSASGTGRVRITPQLIRVSDDTHLWSERYDRVIDDIFEVQSDIAEQVIQQLNITLFKPERRAIEVKPTENTEAYNAYLRGKDHTRVGAEKEDYLLALRMFERAIELDSLFALAYVELADVHTWLCHTYEHTEEHLSQAKNAIDKALALQPDLPEAHRALGYYYYRGYRDYERALEEFTIAAKGLPNDEQTLESFAWIWRRQGRWEEALRNLRKAFELNPRSAGLVMGLGSTLTNLRRYSEAEFYFDRCIALAPDYKDAYITKAWNYFHWDGNLSRVKATMEKMPHVDYRSFVWIDWFERNYESALRWIALIPTDIFEEQFTFGSKALWAGLTYRLMGQTQAALAQFDSARVQLEDEIKKRPDVHHIHSSLGKAYAGLGRKEDAIREGLLGEKLMPVSKDALVGIYRVLDLIDIYSLVGECEEAIDRIEYLMSIRSWVSLSVLRLHPVWDPLRDHPRFQALIEKYEKEHGT